MKNTEVKKHKKGSINSLAFWPAFAGLILLLLIGNHGSVDHSYRLYNGCHRWSQCRKSHVCGAGGSDHAHSGNLYYILFQTGKGAQKVPQ